MLKSVSSLLWLKGKNWNSVLAFYPVHRRSTFALSLLGSRCRPMLFRIENEYFELDEQVLLCVDVIEILSFKYALRRKSSTLLSVGHVWLQCLWFVYFMSIFFYFGLSNLMVFKGDARILVILGVACEHDTSLGYSTRVKLRDASVSYYS